MQDWVDRRDQVLTYRCQNKTRAHGPLLSRDAVPRNETQSKLARPVNELATGSPEESVQGRADRRLAEAARPRAAENEDDGQRSPEFGLSEKGSNAAVRANQ